MAEPMSTVPTEQPINYLPYIIMISIGTMISITSITIWGNEKGTEIITIIAAGAATTIAALIGLMASASQKMGLATHKAVNSVVAKWVSDTEEATRIAKLAADAAVAAALIAGKAEGQAEQLTEMRKALEIARTELAKIADMRRIVEERMAGTPAGQPIQTSPTLSAMVIKEPDGTVKPVVVEEKK